MAADEENTTMIADEEGHTHVLVPLDGSPLAEEALRQALDTFDGPVTVLSVVTPIDAGMSESGILEKPDSELPLDHTRLDEIVQDILARTETMDRQVEAVIETGEPAETILTYVDEHDIDHVVMGGHGGEVGTAGRLVGTVATEIVADSSVPVTVVH